MVAVVAVVVVLVLAQPEGHCSNCHSHDAEDWVDRVPQPPLSCYCCRRRCYFVVVVFVVVVVVLVLAVKFRELVPFVRSLGQVSGGLHVLSALFFH